MNIKQTYLLYNDYFSNGSDFCLHKVNESIYVGIDSSHNLSVLIESSNPNGDSHAQKSKVLSVETNQLITYDNQGKIGTGVFHVIKCYSHEKKIIDIFLELCDAYFFNAPISSNEINEIFITLASFFTAKKSCSREELQGLFAELYTIYYFQDICNLFEYWQSKDKLKFDFSLTSKTKLEIKSTTKDIRVHRFNHEQLATKIYDVYVLSYLLRYDDSGLSLKKLIDNCLSLAKNYPNKKERLLKILYLCTSEELDEHIYSEEYIKNNLRLYKAQDIPHFEDQEGVSNASYNSNFENIPSINGNEITSLLNDLLL